MDTALVEVLERWGGWGVVVWIVYWLTTRWEKRMSDMVDTVRNLALTLKAHQEDEHRTLQSVVDRTQDVATRTCVESINTKLEGIAVHVDAIRSQLSDRKEAS